MNIFISWSGDRSRQMAEFLQIWLRKVIQAVSPWVSNENIEKGSKWGAEIGEKLEDCDFGIVCVTPENLASPWLLFESGALSKSLRKARVCPLLLGLTVDEIEGPLSQFQSTILTKPDLLLLMNSINNCLEDRKLEKEILQDSFNQNWPALEEEMKRIADIEIEDANNQAGSVIKIFSSYGLSQETIGRQVLFANGFESHNIYTIVTQNAKKRLYVLGRKNRKLFDKEHGDFFSKLRSKLSNCFDLRILCLDPEAPSHVMEAAHRDDDFCSQLRECSLHAVEMLKRNGINPNEVLRKYSINRTMSCIIIDDAVLFTPVVLDEEGRAIPLTKTPFSVTSINSELGDELLKSFLTMWNNARAVV